VNIDDVPLFFEGTLLRETDLAIMIEVEGNLVWLPKSKIVWMKVEDKIEIEMPTWLARRSELI
jgi:hypothetical protein